MKGIHLLIKENRNQQKSKTKYKEEITLFVYFMVLIADLYSH